jgi:hypothetical protein
MPFSNLLNLSKLAEQTVDETIAFIGRFLATLGDCIFRPWRVTKFCFEKWPDQEDAAPPYIRPTTYLVLMLVFFSLVFDFVRGIVISIASPVGAMLDQPDLVTAMYGNRWYTANFGLPLLAYLAPPVFGVALFGKAVGHLIAKEQGRRAIGNIFSYAAGTLMLGITLGVFWQSGNIMQAEGQIPLIINAMLGDKIETFSLNGLNLITLILLGWVALSLHLWVPKYQPLRRKSLKYLYWLAALGAGFYFAGSAVNYSLFLIQRHDEQSANKATVSVFKGKTVKPGREYELTLLLRNSTGQSIALRDGKVLLLLADGSNFRANGFMLLGNALEFGSEPAMLPAGKEVFIQANFIFDENTMKRWPSGEKKDAILKKRQNPFELYSHMNPILVFQTADRSGNPVRRMIEQYPYQVIFDELRDLDKKKEG